jgi:hypothetical protein
MAAALDAHNVQWSDNEELVRDTVHTPALPAPRSLRAVLDFDDAATQAATHLLRERGKLPPGASLCPAAALRATWHADRFTRLASLQRGADSVHVAAEACKRQCTRGVYTAVRDMADALTTSVQGAHAWVAGAMEECAAQCARKVVGVQAGMDALCAAQACERDAMQAFSVELHDNAARTESSKRAVEKRSAARAALRDGARHAMALSAHFQRTTAHAEAAAAASLEQFVDSGAADAAASCGSAVSGACLTAKQVGADLLQDMEWCAANVVRVLSATHISGVNGSDATDVAAAWGALYDATRHYRACQQGVQRILQCTCVLALLPE